MIEKTITTTSTTYLSPVLGRYHQIEYEKGEGCYLWDTNGQRYLDMASGLGVTSTGHCHPKVTAAICKQAQTLIHPCIGNGHYAPPARLAQTLSQLVSKDVLFTAFFAQSGSEANEAAIKLAKYVTKRKKLIAFQGGFHGRTLGSLSLTTSKMKYRDGYEPLLEGISFFPYPYTYRCPFGKTTEEDSTNAAIQALQESPLFNEDVAAVIIEPALGEGGYIPAPKAFLKALRTRCTEKGILLIFDEIQTGIGRTGTWFAFEHSDVLPDIITLAKGIASGMPLSACLAKKTIMDQWSPGAHGGTFGANPVSCAAANATLDVIENYLPTLPEKSKKAFEFLNTTLATHPNVGDIRGYGYFIGIELVKDKTSKAPFPELIKPILEMARKNGVIIISCGLHDNVLRLIPPLTIDEDTLLSGLSLICDAIKTAAC